MSEFLTRRLRVGQAVEVSEAFGDLGFAAEDARPRLLLAGGVGITPMLAHVRSLAAVSSPVSTVLLYWARRRIDLCFASELEALAARLPSLSVRMLLTRSERPDPRLDAASLAALVPDLADRTVLACGPGGFVEAARSAAADRSALFRSEAFEPLRAAAVAGGEVVVRLLQRGKELRIPRGQPLLQALEAAGMTLPSGCRMGICNTCACSALAGQTRDLRSQALSSGDAQAVRLCVSAAETDLTLDL
jgi:ferredoxin-NADP reductase